MTTRFSEPSVPTQESFGSRVGLWLQGFAYELNRAGYAAMTARRHIRAAEHFMHWTDRRGIATATLNELFVEKFGQYLHRCRCPHYGRSLIRIKTNGARLFLSYLHNLGVVSATLSMTPTPEPLLVTTFLQWMRQQRGTCSATLHSYTFPIRELLRHIGDDPCRFDAQKLRQFVLKSCRQSGWAAAKKCTTAVRMFLRFLIAEGRCPAALAAAIPRVAQWRLSSLPRYLQSDDIERLIASCDCATAVGRRDRAILLLLARLALRAGDIAMLDLKDIDWEQAWIHVSGKGRRQTRLPLTQEVGDALVAYLQDGRPQIGIDKLFIRSFAPYRALGSRCTVSAIVARAMRRAGVSCPTRGAAHLLRHSQASSMLRQGRSLQEIAEVLRHRSIQTTEIYAKVDVISLETITQPWPEVELC